MGKVQFLAADHPLDADRPRKGGDRPDHLRGRDRRVRQRLKGHRQKAVSGEQGGRLVKLPVAGGAAPAEVRIVHTGEVVVDEGVSLHHLNPGSERRASFQSPPQSRANSRVRSGRIRLPPAKAE